MPNALFKVDTCGSCYRPIIWAITPAARTMPVDAEPPLAGGSIALEHRGAGVKPLAKILGTAAQFGRRELRTSHFATCPDAAKWRRQRKASHA